MIDKHNRKKITEQIGDAVDSLVIDLYSEIIDGVSAIQEAEISSRICQRLEDKLDNSRVGEYTFRVTAQSVPDRGPKSIENLVGADIYLSISLDGDDGFDKGIFIQAKYDRNLKRKELNDACNKMKKTIGNKGSYVWIFKSDGVKVLSANQVKNMEGNSIKGLIPRSVEGFAGRIIDCYAGNRNWGVPASANRRKLAAKKLRESRAANLLDIHLKKS